MKAIALTALLAAAGVPAVAASPDTDSWAASHGCRFEHPSSDSYRATTRLLKHERPVGRATKQRVSKWATCVTTRRKAHAVHEHVRELWGWRHSYAHVWEIRRAGLDGGILARLDVLGGCETRGIPYPQNYQYSGHHHGRYQYLVETWNRAQGYYAAVTGRKVVGWTSVAYAASPAHQDVVTAVFFPAHSGEWACSA